MNYNRAGAPPSQNLTPQQLAAQRQRMSMLPPQFQNLSPQQLQELRNKPQFQNMMRQYQRQMAQQQMSQQADSRPGSTPANMYNSMGQTAASSMNMNMGGANRINDPLPMSGSINPSMGMNANALQNASGMLQMQNRNPQSSFMQQQAKQSSQMSQSLQRSGMASIPGNVGMGPNTMGSANGMSGPLMGGPQRYAALLAQQRQITTQGAIPGLVNVPNTTGGSNFTPNFQPLEPPFPTKGAQPRSGTPTGLVKEKVRVPPQFAPDALQKITLTPLTSLNEWSEKLKKEDKTVPLDVKLYEDIIKKDDFYLRKNLLQNQLTKELIDRMTRDVKSFGTIKQLRMGAINAAAKNQYNNSIWGEGYLGYGNGVTNSATQVVMPLQNKCFAKPGQLAMRDEDLNRKVMKNAKATKQIVPIRLEFDQERDRFKLRDTFLWDLSDTSYPIEALVRNLIDDYSFISEINFQTVMQSVNEQIKEYRPKPLNAIGEIRIPIKIDLLINNTQFTDQFEWDILSDKDGDPEEFASVLCDELSLPGDFATAISFSIREQSQMYLKALSLVGYTFDGSHIREDEIKSHMAPPLRIQNSDMGHDEDFLTTLRTPSMLSDYSPAVNRVSQLEIEKIEKEMERDSRRRRRHNNDGAFSYNENGPNLFGSLGRGTASRRSALHNSRGVKTTIPDLADVPKTFRTPLPSSVLPCGIDLGAPEIYSYNELVVNRTQIPNPEFKPPAPPGMVTVFKDSAGSFFVKIKSRRLRR